jgi:DNA-binding XRE family transcriptional regulator
MNTQRQLNRYTADIIAQMNAGETHLFLVALAASVIEHVGGSSRVCRFDGGSPITNKLRFNLEGVEYELKIREQKRGLGTCKAILYAENKSGRMVATHDSELAGTFWLRDMRPGLGDSVDSLSEFLNVALERRSQPSGIESFGYDFVKQLLINWNEIAQEGAARQAERKAAGLPTLPASMNAKPATLETTTTEDDMTTPKNETPEQTTARKAKDAKRKREARAAKKAATIEAVKERLKPPTPEEWSAANGSPVGQGEGYDHRDDPFIEARTKQPGLTISRHGVAGCSNTVDLERGTTPLEDLKAAKVEADARPVADMVVASPELADKPTHKVTSFGDIAAGAALSSSGLDPICVWLKATRLEAGLTQTALAELSGVKQPNIARAERGVIPTVPVLRRYCAVLGEYTLAGPS